jgi:hypothetical protein
LPDELRQPLRPQLQLKRRIVFNGRAGNQTLALRTDELLLIVAIGHCMAILNAQAATRNLPSKVAKLYFRGLETRQEMPVR